MGKLDSREVTPVGLFLDVDKTLTSDYVQRSFARELNVSKPYEALEEKFQKDGNAADFANGISELFCDANFHISQVESICEAVELNSYAEEVLSLPVTKYLVTNGPSYYCHHLAKRYGIDLDNTFSSHGKFDRDGNFVRFREGSIKNKADFVKKRSVNHLISIGVGDSIHHDAFLHHCTIPIIFGGRPTDSYFSASSLKVVEGVVSELVNECPSHGRVIPNIFLGCASEALPMADAIKEVLEDKADCNVRIWRDGFFDISEVAIEQLIIKSLDYDFAIFIMSDDDVVNSRGVEYVAPRDNVVFEYGMFVARLGANRNFVFIPEDAERKMKIMSDINGVMLIKYSKDVFSGNVKNILSKSISGISGAIQRSGVLPQNRIHRGIRRVR